MKILVTGAAGFIGSSTAEYLIGKGHDVVGIDCFTDYYARDIKERNLHALRRSPAFEFVEQSLMDADLKALLTGVQGVYHAAAQAGVRASWGRDFDIYVQNNIRATQMLLEAAKDSDVSRFVYASSSSVYGDAVRYPVTEDLAPQPVSPYGVSKLAAEHLCYLYWKNFGVPAVSLRYFTVFGPRQRPDMGFHKFIRAMLTGQEITVYGDGTQTRDFTYISDIVNANAAALECGDQALGKAINIGGGNNEPLHKVFEMLAEITGVEPRLTYIEKQKGDVLHTYADITLARSLLGFAPEVPLRDGLEREADWLRAIL
jgi:UDP-glucose 4-epimerase